MLKHVIPCIGNVKLCDLKVVHLEKYLRELKKIKNNNRSTIQLNFRNLKTESSYRILALSDNLIDELRLLRLQQLENKLLFGSEYHINIYIH